MRTAFLGVRVVGHLNPMTTLARKLKARGHDVVFISVLDSEPYVRRAQPVVGVPRIEILVPHHSIVIAADRNARVCDPKGGRPRCSACGDRLCR